MTPTPHLERKLWSQHLQTTCPVAAKGEKRLRHVLIRILPRPRRGELSQAQESTGNKYVSGEKEIKDLNPTERLTHHNSGPEPKPELREGGSRLGAAHCSTIHMEKSHENFVQETFPAI